MAEANDSLREDHREGTKTQVSCQRSARKNSEQLLSPPSLCSSFEGVPCDLPDPTLWLTEGTAALLISPTHMVPCPPPPLHSPSPLVAHLTVTTLQGGKDDSRRGWWWWGGSHQGETLPVGSRQFQAIAPCSLGFCLHTQTRTHTRIQAEADDC